MTRPFRHSDFSALLAAMLPAGVLLLLLPVSCCPLLFPSLLPSLPVLLPSCFLACWLAHAACL